MRSANPPSVLWDKEKTQFGYFIEQWMFALQLLRILQTIPTDVNYETRAFDAPKPKLTMTENQIGTLCDSNSYEKKADPFCASASDPLHANGHGGNPSPLEFGIQDGHDFWINAVPKSSVLDNSTESNGNEPSLTVGDQDCPCHLNGFEKDTEAFVFDTKDTNETENAQEALHCMIDGKSANCNAEDFKDSDLSTNVPQAFESDWNPFLDKNVVDCELPEFVVCYRESQIVKDICVDEGVPTDDKILTESDKDDNSGSFSLQPSDEERHIGTTKGGPDIELFVPDGFKTSSPEDISHNSACEFGSKKIDGKPSDDDTDERSSISSACVSGEFILHDALLESSKCDENKVAQQHDEIPSIEAILESLAVAFTSEESRKDGPVSSMPYNSKVEGGTITFDFNSSKPAVTSSMNGNSELTPGKTPEPDREKLNDHLAPAPVQLANSEEKLKENAADSDPPRREAAIDENGNSDNLSVSNRLQRGEGESSFSTSGPVSGLITYSGPIAFSGSISLRSDSSTTSTRSFAFPILQPEWNSSPVRMEKAERRHLRKQRGWRHGLLCCRF